MRKLLVPLVVPLGLIVTILTSCTGDHPSGSTGQLVCPKVISVKQTLLKRESNWESFEDDLPSRLISVMIYDGHPKERAALVPDQETESNRRLVFTWHLVENGKRRYWTACYYDQTRIVLAHLISSEVSTCEVTCDPYITIAGQPAILDVTFK
ncbi:MAG: STY0301 family protein [Candidatus Desantisbacteria bacterium]